jgi:hypothetical protein
VVSYVDLMPSSGIVSFGIGMNAASSSSSLRVARPVLAEVGVRYDTIS